MLAQPHSDDRRHTELLHGHTVHRVGGLHRPRIVRNDDELRIRFELVEQPQEPLHIGVIERCINLVEQTKGAWLGEINSEEKRDSYKRSLAGR